MVLEQIERFLCYTAIKEDTFGRLVMNDPHLIAKLREGATLKDDAAMRIMGFMQRYEDAKD